MKHSESSDTYTILSDKFVYGIFLLSKSYNTKAKLNLSFKLNLSGTSTSSNLLRSLNLFSSDY